MESTTTFIAFGRQIADTHYPKRMYHYELVKLFVAQFDLNESNIDLYINLLFAYQSKKSINIPYTTLIFHNILPRMPSYEIVEYFENIGLIAEDFKYNDLQESSPRILLAWSGIKKCLNAINKSNIINEVILIDLGYDSYCHRYISINAIETMRYSCNDWAQVSPLSSATI